MSWTRSAAGRRDDVAGRRDLALAAVTIVGLSRLIEPPGVWFVAIFLLGAMLLGTLQVLGDERARADGAGLGVPVESLILPAVAAVACVGAIRLVPFGLGLAPALLVTGVLVDRCLALEARIVAAPAELDAEGRTAVLVTTLLVGVPRIRRRGRHDPGWTRPARVGRSRGRAAAGTGPPGPGGRGRRDRVPARVSRGGAAGVERSRRPVVRGDVRGGHRDRRRRRALPGDPTTAGSGAAGADVLPVGRLPRRGARRAAAIPAGCGRSCCWWRSGWRSSRSTSWLEQPV